MGPYFTPEILQKYFLYFPNLCYTKMNITLWLHLTEYFIRAKHFNSGIFQSYLDHLSHMKICGELLSGFPEVEKRKETSFL